MYRFGEAFTVLQVELLIPQLTFLDDEGAQAELWELSRIFVDTLMEQTGCQVCCSFRILSSTMIYAIYLNVITNYLLEDQSCIS